VNGQLQESLVLARRSLAASSISRHFELALMAEIHHEMGNLRQAIELASEAVATGEVSTFRIAETALCYANVGQIDTALDRLATITDDGSYDRRLGEAEAYLLVGRPERAAQAIADIPDHERGLSANLVLAHIYTARADFTDAHLVFSGVLRAARAGGYVAQELRSLCGLAEMYRVQDEYERARDHLHDLRELAARGPYRLIQADAANILAAIERDCGNLEAALAAARNAYVLAWCDGPPRAYHWGLQRAARMLEECGAELPDVQRSSDALDSR
jgi:hypothetical protein